MKKGISLIGYGALGKILAEAIQTSLSEWYEISGIWSRSVETHRKELEEKKIPVYENLEELLADVSSDYVVEIAGIPAVGQYGRQILNAGKNLIVTSAGALADEKLRAELEAAAVQMQKKIYVPSGAIGGFDIFQAITMMGNAEGKIESFKAPKSLNGAPALDGRMLSEKEEEKIFEGTARDAIQGFPKNVNVAVSSALSSVGIDEMRTCIVSRPGMKANMHRVTVKNDSVQAVLEVSSRPDPKNPKSSIVTAWSVAGLLKNLAAPISFF